MTEHLSVLEVPQDVLDSAGLTLDQLRIELAVHLYEERRLGIGKARELAGLSLGDFRQILGTRGIAPHFDMEDLEQDLATLRELQLGTGGGCDRGVKEDKESNESEEDRDN